MQSLLMREMRTALTNLPPETFRVEPIAIPEEALDKNWFPAY